jgi:hypothetical protein
LDPSRLLTQLFLPLLKIVENRVLGAKAVCFGRKQLLAVAQFIVGIVEKTRFLGIRLVMPGKELGLMFSVDVDLAHIAGLGFFAV